MSRTVRYGFRWAAREPPLQLFLGFLDVVYQHLLLKRTRACEGLNMIYSSTGIGVGKYVMHYLLRSRLTV